MPVAATCVFTGTIGDICRILERSVPANWHTPLAPRGLGNRNVTGRVITISFTARTTPTTSWSQRISTVILFTTLIMTSGITACSRSEDSPSGTSSGGAAGRSSTGAGASDAANASGGGGGLKAQVVHRPVPRRARRGEAGLSMALSRTRVGRPEGAQVALRREVSRSTARQARTPAVQASPRHHQTPVMIVGDSISAGPGCYKNLCSSTLPTIITRNSNSSVNTATIAVVSFAIVR